MIHLMRKGWYVDIYITLYREMGSEYNDRWWTSEFHRVPGPKV